MARQSFPVAIGDGVDAVHDSLVVRCSPVGIGNGEVVRQHDAVAHKLGAVARSVASDVQGDIDGLRCHEGFVGKIREYPQHDVAAADCSPTFDAMLSHIELTMFAPIASRVSTSKCSDDSPVAHRAGDT